jgi:hypothetical protein
MNPFMQYQPPRKPSAFSTELSEFVRGFSSLMGMVYGITNLAYLSKEIVIGYAH